MNTYTAPVFSPSLMALLPEWVGADLTFALKHPDSDIMGAVIACARLIRGGYIRPDLYGKAVIWLERLDDETVEVAADMAKGFLDVVAEGLAQSPEHLAALCVDRDDAESLFLAVKVKEAVKVAEGYTEGPLFAWSRRLWEACQSIDHGRESVISYNPFGYGWFRHLTKEGIQRWWIPKPAHACR